MKKGYSIIILNLLFVYSVFFSYATRYGSWIKVVSIAFILYLALTSSLYKEKYVIIALCFTLAADVSMLLIHNNNMGLSFFISVQLIYRLRYKQSNCLIILSLTFIILPIPLHWKCAYYISLLIGNIILSYQNQAYRVTLAFILFLACDLFVGIQYLSDISSSTIDHLIYLFYLPSQYLLMCSMQPKKKQVWTTYLFDPL